jgi:acyl-CoA synthetase (AMP-forming)/AMP-acid ligase II
MSPHTLEAARAPSENVSRRLAHWAASAPDRIAVRASDGRELSYGELDRRADALAHGLAEHGLAPGDRASLFVRPGQELVLAVHACFRSGVVPVLIDPGMGRAALLACIEAMAPRGLIGVPRAQLARRLHPRAFRSVELAVTVGARLPFSGPGLADVERAGEGRGPLPPRPAEGDAPAAVLFTSGSTGPPKGVTLTHANFAAELAALARLYELEPGEVDCACFPLFALFDHALGLTSVFPPVDPTRPAEVEPERLVATIEASGATFAFGSPAIWRRVAPWMAAHGRRFSRLRRVTIAGASVPPRLVAALRALLPAGGEVHVPYGATEVLPVSNLTGAESEALRPRIEGGEGTCVGRIVDGLEVALLRIDDGPFEAFADELCVSSGSPGEVCVRGAAVSAEYAADPHATRLAKIPCGPRPEHRPWHRMGDVGRFDDEGRLWLLGRKSERIESARGTLHTLPLENAYDTLPGVRRSALVGTGPRGAQVPTLVVEPEPGADLERLARALRAHRPLVADAGSDAGTDASAVAAIRFHPSFPVDVRHNAKIRRDELRRWAEARAPGDPE